MGSGGSRINRKGESEGGRKGERERERERERGTNINMFHNIFLGGRGDVSKDL